MQVSGVTASGEPKKLSQESLAKTSRIARSTISKYLTQQDSVNPDLDTLCRLAAALNISPALLLMSEDDWLRLAHALSTVGHAMTDKSVSEMIISLGSEANNKPLTRASTVMRMARYFGYGNLIEDGRENKVSRKLQQGILATSAMPMHPDFKIGFYAYILPLCIVMGAQVIEPGDLS
ncbi:helix-turn-helix domain-containing protein [Pseudomonas cichorii]|nr:helix-turn-helix domain-containing protein [Pseudomonas cichorii]